MAYTFPHSSPEALARPESDPDLAQEYTKDETNYRDAGGSETNCGNCLYYVGEGVCELVAGSISTDAVCDLFTQARPSVQDLVV